MKIDLLNNDEMRGNVIKTTGTKKITINGETKNYLVYRISIRELFYNDKNDRIASEISEYKDRKNLDNFEVSHENIEEYNDIVSDFIKNSDSSAYNRTKGNICKYGQRRPGVVLSDGRIIDGNRRYTCLRELYNELGEEKFRFFEAVILPENEVTEKSIKSLELQIQFGEEERVQYDIIDRCAGIYKSLIMEGHLFDEQEYCENTGETLNEVRKLVEKTNLIVEFLEYINAPLKFYIAKDLKIDGPISELLSVKKNAYNEDGEDLWNKIKAITFSQILVKTENDITRSVRNFKNTIKKPDQIEELYEDVIDIVEDINDKLEDMDNINSDEIKMQIRSDEELVNELNTKIRNHIEKIKIEDIKDKPNIILSKIINELSGIDRIIASDLGAEEKESFNKKLIEIQKQIDELRGL